MKERDVFKVFVCLLFVRSIANAPTKNPQFPTTQVLDFMKKFGYLENDDGESEALYTEEGISEAVKTLQMYGDLPQTGIIDNSTLNLLTKKRCGVPDIIKNKRSKRFVLSKKGWQKRQITYFLANWSPKLGEDSIHKNVQKALDLWGRYGRLKFRRVFSPDADIIVAFGNGYHGDSFPFDGPGNILAHAFFPYEFGSLGGDIHFDNDEDWIDKKSGSSKEGTDFFTVALHELGHSLGLAHSPVPTSVMFPYYKGTEEERVDYDDILGMYELYIRRYIPGDENLGDENIDETSSETSVESSTISTTSWTDHVTTESYYPSTESVTESDKKTVTYEGDSETVDDHKEHDPMHNIPKSNTPSLPRICDGKFDAIATLRNELFVFRDSYVWRLRDKGIVMPGYPILIKQMFTGLPENITKVDAVYERPDGNVVIFIGRDFYVFDGRQFIENSPRKLTDYGLPEYLNGIDAVQTWGKNKKTYFYKRDRFWRYNESTKTMDKGYPLRMDRWRGVPEDLDSATTWKDGSTYFFKGELFWKFDNNWVNVVDGYPLPTAQVWLGCEEDEHTMRRLFY